MLRQIINSIIHSSAQWPWLFDQIKALSRIGSKNKLFLNLRKLSRSKQLVHFLQIGASDGLRYDPIREFVIQGHWVGSLVEPLPHVFERLRKNYEYTKLESSGKIHFINAAISTHSGHVQIYEIRSNCLDKSKEYVEGFSSLDRNHVQKHLDNLSSSENSISETQVRCLTPEELIKTTQLNGLDLLVLDVEGHEYEILMAFPFLTGKPKVILYESNHLNQKENNELNSMLMDHGYQMITIGNDTWAELNETLNS